MPFTSSPPPRPDSAQRVSVVIPARDRNDVLLRALDSVAAQTRPVFEVVIVDDGSATPVAVALAGRRYPFAVRTLRTARPQGAGAARNRAIAAAEGELIAFLDSDDAWCPGKIAAQARAFADPDVAACGSGILHVDARGRALALRRPPDGPELSSALFGANVLGTTSAVMARRSALAAVGGFAEDLPSCQDWDLWLRLAGHGRIAVAPEILTIYQAAGPERISSSARTRLAGHRVLYRRHLRERLRDDDAARAAFLFTAGEICLLAGRKRWGVQAWEAWAAAQPSNLRRQGQLALARAGCPPALYRAVMSGASRLRAVLRSLTLRADERTARRVAHLLWRGRPAHAAPRSPAPAMTVKDAPA